MNIVRNVVVGLALLCPALSGIPAVAQQPAAATPPVARVTIFTSGVAEFVHQIAVTDDANLHLDVPADQMSDVIRSLTVLDADGGTTFQIDSPAGEPLDRRLGQFRIDLTAVKSLADLAAALRGVDVSVRDTGGTTYRGRILAVNGTTGGTTDRDGDGELVITRPQGVLRLPIASVEELTVMDAALAAEVDRALAVLRSGSGDGGTRTVTIHLRGSGERTVTLRYLREMPVWKTSYRAVMHDGSVTLQGWAHVDNTSNLDWTGTQLRLVSSAPDTYFFDLYPPQHIARQQRVVGPAAESGLEAPSRALRSMAFDAAPMAEMDTISGSAPSRVAGNQRLTGVALTVSEPVSISRGQSAMIPIVDRSFTAETIRSFDPRSDGDRPRISLAFTNATDTQLPAGPLTIFDGDRYVGDSQLTITPAGADRVIPYARDLQLTVDRSTGAGTEELRTIRIVDGTLVAERRARVTTVYTLIVDGDMPTLPTVRFSHPRRQGWDLVSPEPLEERSDVAVIESRGSRTTVVEEQIREQRYVLTSMDRGTLVEFGSNRLLDPRTRRILQNVVELRDQVQQHQQRRQELETEQAQIFRDQERIRGNMANLDRNSSLYRRYVNDLDQQESRLDLLGDDLRDAREAEQQARDALDAYLRSLND